MNDPTTILIVALISGGVLFFAYKQLTKPRIEYTNPQYSNIAGALAFWQGLK